MEGSTDNSKNVPKNSTSLRRIIELLKVSWLYEMQLSNQIWGHSEYGSDLFFELKLVSPFNSVESWLVKQPYNLVQPGL